MPLLPGHAAPARPIPPGHPSARAATVASPTHPTSPFAHPAATSSASYLQLAETGVVRAERRWHDRRLGWYDERLNDYARYPLATSWGAVPLFEALNAIAIAAPSSKHRAAASAFADGAERYYDRGLRPTPGYKTDAAPSSCSHGSQRPERRGR